MGVRVQENPFDPAKELADFRKNVNGSGALVTFTGIVRDLVDAPLVHMEIEHYPAMTLSALTAMADDAKERFDLEDVLIIHRFGILRPDDDIMMVATAARHRKAAFQGADFLMDYLKSRAPFWKKEHTEAGSEWVASKTEDEDALADWKNG